MQNTRNITGYVFNNVIIRYATFFIVVLMIYNSWQYGRYNGNYINSDGKGYYAYLTAIFIYQDLDYNFVDDYEMKYYSPDSYFHFKREINGDVANITFAGIAVLLLPFFLAAHAGSMVLGLPTDGYAPLYQYGVGFAAVFYLFLALWGLKKLLEIYGVGKYHVVLIQLILVFATPVYFYTTVDASFTHVYSFAMITLFFYYTKRYITDARAKHLYIASILLGLITLIRPTNLMVLAALPFLAGSWPALQDSIKGLFRTYKKLIAGLILFGLVVSIQPLLYYAQVGEFFVWTYTGVGFNFLDPHMQGVLFSYKKGLFVYTPILILSLFGFIHLLRKNVFMAIAMIFYMFIFTYVISSWWSWWYGMSFGHRAFLDHYAVFGLLFGFALTDTKAKIIPYLIYIAAPFAIWMNMIQVYQYKHNILYWDMDEEKFWEVFLKTDEAYHGIFWREAKLEAQQARQREMENKFKGKLPLQTYLFDYDQDLAGVDEQFIKHDVFRSGNTSVAINKRFPYSPGLRTTISELKDTNNILIRASAWVYVPAFPTINTFNLVTSIENEVGTYHYDAVYSRPDEIRPGEWNKIELASETKKIKSNSDILKVYVWYTGEKEVYVDDLKVEFY